MDGDEPIEEPFTWRRAPVLIGDRLGLRPGGVIAALAGVAAVGLGAWWALRTPPPPAEEVLPFVQEVSVPVSTTAAVEALGARALPVQLDLLDAASVDAGATRVLETWGGVDTRVSFHLDWIDDQMRSACEDGTRVWCDIPGIIPPPLPDGTVAWEIEEDIEEKRACGCSASPSAPWGFGALGLAALALVRRRR